MFIRLKNPVDSSTQQTWMDRDFMILNVLFNALFLCPRPAYPGVADDIAPLPFAANPLMLPSVFLGLSLGIPAQLLKSAVPAFINNKTPTAAFDAIGNELIRTVTPTDEDHMYSSSQATAIRRALFRTDRAFYQNILHNPVTCGKSRMECESQFNAAIAPYLKDLMAGSNHCHVDMLLEKHKRLTRMPDSLSSERARQAV